MKHLIEQGAKTPELRVKVDEQHMSEIVGTEKADIKMGERSLENSKVRIGYNDSVEK